MTRNDLVTVLLAGKGRIFHCNQNSCTPACNNHSNTCKSVMIDYLIN